MTTPTGFVVKPASGQHMLMLDKDRAIEKAALMHGRAAPVYTIHQIVKALEEKGEYDTEAAEAVDAVLGLGLGQM